MSLAQVHKPRVHITYDAGDGTGRKELPFVVGVLGDFSGNAPSSPPRPLSERKFIPIARDNFDEIMRRMAPGVRLRVTNTLKNDGSELAVQLQFQSITDFEPAAIVRQVDPLRRLLQTRDRLRDLLAKVDRQPRIEDLLLQEGSFAEDLREWIDPLPALQGAGLKQYIAQRLNRDIARLDAHLNEQVNAVLHHPDFQKLEASWRNLRFLVEQVPENEGKVKVRVLNLSWKELTRDITRAFEFDQSQLFRKVYSEEFGKAGGEPFGILLGDYEIRHLPYRLSDDQAYDDMETLSAVAGVAAAAFAPFVAAVHPSVLDLTSFADLEKPFDLSRTFESPYYLKWKEFRKKEDARFIGLTIPRVLVRLPYVDDSARADGFCFREEVPGADSRNYLWGNAAYGFGAVVIRSFLASSWLAEIRGVHRGELSGGMVADLPVHNFSTDKNGVAPKCSTDTIITDAMEKQLSMLGFIPLCYCQDTELSAFHSNQSVQAPREYFGTAATVNARLSAMLQYILCASRFAHYIKTMVRDRTGTLTGAVELQGLLNQWLRQYINATPDPKYPLRQARVEVEEAEAGKYQCRMFLQPHYQLDQLVSTLRLDSILAVA